MRAGRGGGLTLAGVAIALACAISAAGDTPARGVITVDWTRVVATSKTTPTLQVVVNPPLRRGSPIHDTAFESLRALGCDYVRYVPWLPYPKLGVAELEPPAHGKTSWNFSLIDPMTEDFMNATAGHPVVMNFSTIPQWMFKTATPVPYPDDPDTPTWTYSQGAELRDPTLRELGDYYARLVAWYTKGGFTDEAGTRHESGHHYRIDYWEVLNEPDLEHETTAEQYTERYDAIVSAIRAVAPHMRFVGISLAYPTKAAHFFEYFLDRSNHRAGIPLDMISYHFYAVPTLDQSIEIQPFTFFEQADKFLDVVRYIEQIRRRLSPQIRTTINEIGSISAHDLRQGQPGYKFTPIPPAYWNLSAAVYAYLYGELARIGIDVAGESQLVGYPTQFPSVSMLDWTDGGPNPRYRVLQLIHENFGPGDQLLETSVQLGANQPYVYARGFKTRDGSRRILLVNKRNRPFALSVPATIAKAAIIDQTTGNNEARTETPSGGALTLPGLAVAVLTLE
jgi:hypothetical protein